MTEFYAATELLVDMLGNMLGGIDAAMLSARATEGYLEGGETTIQPALNMKINYWSYVTEKLQDLSVFFKEISNWFVESCQLLILLVSTGIIACSAVENVTSTIARRILRNALLEGEAEDTDGK